jgi:hypothetical protein
MTDMTEEETAEAFLPSATAAVRYHDSVPHLQSLLDLLWSTGHLVSDEYWELRRAVRVYLTVKEMIA